VKQHWLYYLLDSTQGTIYDVRALNAFLGYDVTDSVKGGAAELRTFQNLHFRESEAAAQAAVVEQAGQPQMQLTAQQQQQQQLGAAASAARPIAGVRASIARGRSTQPRRQ
jgi:hypothetical protein